MAKLRDTGHLRLGHARIMLEFECGECAAFVAAEAGKRHDRADAGRALGEPVDLGLQVEVFALDADGGSDAHNILAVC